jgi:hypothetical protein
MSLMHLNSLLEKAETKTVTIDGNKIELRPGSLHRALGVPKDQVLYKDYKKTGMVGKVVSYAKKSGKNARKVNLARVLSKGRPRGGGPRMKREELSFWNAVADELGWKKL